MSAASKPLSMVPVHAPNNALVGQVDDLMRAFDQIAANFAILGLNGWDSVQKCKAACWLAHGKQEHPAVFMENHYVMLIQGRLTIEPKWEYMIRKLKETVPGFSWKVVEETNESATVWMTDGVDEHTVTYTLEDARRQGLLGRTGGNMWTTGNTREGCLKQATKRAARRIGVGRAGWVDVDNIEVAENEPVKVTEDEKVSLAEERGPDRPPITPPAALLREPLRSEMKDAVKELSKTLVKLYKRKLPKEEALEKAALVYNEMMKAETGVSPNISFRSPDQIGPLDAEKMIKYLNEGRFKGAQAQANAAAEQKMKEIDKHLEPIPEAVVPVELPQEELPLVEIDLRAYDDFMDTVKKARAAFDRKFVVAAPPGSGHLYFIDSVTLNTIGLEKSVKVSEDGELVASEQLIAQLTKVMKEAVAAKERGR